MPINPNKETTFDVLAGLLVKTQNSEDFLNQGSNRTFISAFALQFEEMTVGELAQEIAAKVDGDEALVEILAAEISQVYELNHQIHEAAANLEPQVSEALLQALQPYEGNEHYRRLMVTLVDLVLQKIDPELVVTRKR
jgi:hypothetical protein